MLNLSKPALIIILSILVTACGYQRSNSREFPHKHIQEISPQIKGLEMTWIDTTNNYGADISDFSDQAIFYNCSNENNALCRYNFNTKKITKFLLPQIKSTDQSVFLTIQYIRVINDQNLIIIFNGSVVDGKQAVFLLNIPSKKIQLLNTFQHLEFSEQILESLINEGIYEKQNTEGYISYYATQTKENSNTTIPQVEVETEEFKITNITWRDLQEFWSELKSTFLIFGEEPSNGLAPYELSISPTDQFDEKFKQEFSKLIEAHHIQCFYELKNDELQNKGNLLLQSKQQPFYVESFIDTSLFQEYWKLPVCGDLEYPSLVNSNYLKYTSIDKVKSSGNHFMFWFDPVGFDVFELKQNGDIKQFKAPINTAELYQIQNELIVKIDQKIYHIHM